jgi:hypothetical protein
MRLFLVLAAILLGLAAGSALTVYVTGPAANRFTQNVGTWAFSPAVGSPTIDPYTRSRLFASGELPLAAGEGYALQALTDAAGRPLDSRCSYRLSGPFPPARYWTVTLSDKAGKLLTNLAGRQGFTSAEIVRAAGASFAIEIGPEPLAGNWLPIPAALGAFDVILRFYETPLAATATQFDVRSLPALVRLGCPA